MKHIYLNLRRFDVPVELGGVNRLAPVAGWGRAIVEGTGGELCLEAPFVTWSKADIVREGLALGVPYELTWSCYEGGEAPCGRCATCLDRAAAFAANGVEDPAMR